MAQNQKSKQLVSKTFKNLLVAGVFLSGLGLSTGLEQPNNHDNNFLSLETLTASASTAKSYNTPIKNAGTYRGIPIYASNLMEQTLAVGMLRGNSEISFSGISNAKSNEVAKALNYVSKQNPLILDVKSYGIYRNSLTGNVTKVKFYYYSTKKSILAKQNAIVNEANKVYNSNIRPKVTAQAKVDAAYNYFMTNQIYDMDAYNHNLNNTLTESSYNSYTVYNVFTKHKGVCQGYAGALTLLLRMANIDAVNVTGYMKGEDHMWTRVRLNNSDIYDYDVTPSTSGPLIPFSRYRLDKDQMSGYNYIQDSLWGTPAMLQKYTLSTIPKDYFTANNLSFTDINQFKSYIIGQYNKGITTNTFKFKNGNNRTLMETAFYGRKGTPVGNTTSSLSILYRDDIYTLILK